ncbi:unnamed protein product, partial [Nesidiocoris tenuis]
MLENTLRLNAKRDYGPYSQHFLGIRSRSMRKHFVCTFHWITIFHQGSDPVLLLICFCLSKTPLFNRNSDVLNYKRYSKGSLASALSSFDPRAFAPSNPTMVIRSGPSIFAEQSLILEF